MLTGRIPSGRARAARDWNRKIPKELDALIDHMLEMDATDRPASVSAVKESLKTIGALHKSRRIGIRVLALFILLAVGGIGYTVAGHYDLSGMATKVVERFKTARKEKATVKKIRRKSCG